MKDKDKLPPNETKEIKYRGFRIRVDWLNNIEVWDKKGFVWFKSLSVDAAKEQIDERLFESRS